MKRRMNKRMAAATLAGAMVLSMNGMAWAEVTEFNLTKEVTTDGNTHAPNTTFRFTITEGDASTFEGAVVSAGVKDGLTLDTANNFSFAPGDKVLASYTKTGKIKVDATKFTEPGVYHYLVTETQDTYDGITYDVTPRHVYVYVVNGTDGYEVEAVKVVKDGDTAKEDNLKIVNSYGDGSTPNDDIHDFIIKKTVTGNQGHKNKPFSFTVTIDGDDADKEGAEKYMAVKTPKTGEAETIHITDGLTQTFTLMDGETLHIYGLSEIAGPGVAFECPAQQGMHINEDFFYPEIINPDTEEVLPDGEFGELVFTCIGKEALPLIRYRTRDICKLERGTCSCGRTLVKMCKPKGRTDDMLIIRGINVFPSQIEAVLLSLNMDPNYQIVVDRANNTDSLEVQVEMTADMFQDTLKSLTEIERKIASALQSILNISAKVRLLEPKSIPRSEGKAKRVIDKRHLT